MFEWSVNTQTLPGILLLQAGSGLGILELLFQHAGKVLSKDDVFNAAWGRDYLPSSRTLDQQISKLRKLVEKNPKEPKIIQTVHGVGYRFE